MFSKFHKQSKITQYETKYGIDRLGEIKQWK